MTSTAPGVLSDLCVWLAAHGSSCPELFGFITGVLNVWLVTREHIWSWPVGVVNAAFFMVVFTRTGLYSDTGLQVVYLVLSLYGWWHWRRGGESRTPLTVTRTASRTAIRLLAIAVVGWIALALITRRMPGAALPWLDAAVVSVSLVAQYMMTRKLLEHWLLWIAVDVVYVGLFINRLLLLTAILYTVFLALAIIGFVQWKRSAAKSAHRHSPALS